MKNKSQITNHQSLQNAIVLQGVSKRYTLTKERPLLLKNLFVPSKKEEIWALKDVSLEIKKGETIGIIGENGSGKSTLLKIISGITIPTSGEVEVNGRVASLIELGAGFQPDLTGKENVYLNGTLLGLTKKEIDKKYKEIVDFADIPEFIDQPVRTYSSGMTVRLGFSVAVHLDPDILLIDEVLAVGDEQFQRKCINKIKDFERDGKTILIVSHNLVFISKHCSISVWIDNHKVKYLGHSNRTIANYLNKINSKFISLPFYTKRRWGNGSVKITSFNIFNVNGKRVKVFDNKDDIILKARVKFYKNILNPVFGIVIRNSESEEVFVTNTHVLGLKSGYFKRGEERVINYFLRKKFQDGKYSISPAIAAENLKDFYDWQDNYYQLTVKNIAKENYQASNCIISIEKL